MVFFHQFRYFFTYFLVFGLWSTLAKPRWLNILFRINSFVCLPLLFLLYLNAIIIDHFLGQKSLRGSVNVAVMFICISVSILAIIIEILLYSDAQFQLVQMFSSVDYIVKINLGIRISYVDQKKNHFIQICTLVSLAILPNVLILLYLHFVIRMSVSSFIHFEVYLSFITRLRLIQILFLTCLVRDRLRLISHEVINIQRSIQLKQCSIPKRVVLIVHNALQDRVLCLKQIYRLLYKIYALISQIFGLSLLAIVMQCIIDFIFNCYSTFLYLNDASYLANDLVPLTITCFVDSIAFFIIFCTLTFHCSSCSEHVSSV